METQTFIIKGLYPDRIVVVFHIGGVPQSIIIGFSELHNFFDDKAIKYITGNDFEIVGIKPDFKLFKSMITIPSGEVHAG
jgi:hypothetical protein